MNNNDIIEGFLLYIHSKHPSYVLAKEYFRSLNLGDIETQTKARDMATDELLKYKLIETQGYPPTRANLAITEKGIDAVNQGGYLVYVNKTQMQTTRENEFKDLTYDKLKYDYKNSVRIYKTYWLTFGMAALALIISLTLLILKLIELPKQLH